MDICGLFVGQRRAKAGHDPPGFGVLGENQERWVDHAVRVERGVSGSTPIVDRVGSVKDYPTEGEQPGADPPRLN